MKNINEITEQLIGFIGTEHFYHRLFKRSVYTDGFFTFMNLTNSHWFYDIIETEILTIALKGKLQLDTYRLEFQALGDWDVKLTLFDYQDNLLWEKKTHSDFDYLGKIDFVLGWDGERLITCLTSEN